MEYIHASYAYWAPALGKAPSDTGNVLGRAQGKVLALMKFLGLQGSHLFLTSRNQDFITAVTHIRKGGRTCYENT